MRVRYIALGLLATMPAVHAQDAPAKGLLHSNAGDASSVTYACGPVLDGRLTCQITETRLRKNLEVAAIPDRMRQAEQQFPKDKPYTDEECKPLRDLLEIAEGRRPPHDPKAYDASSPELRAKIADNTRPFVAYCDAPTLQNYLAMVRAAFLHQAELCTVTSATFSESYEIVSAPDAPLPVWEVVAPQPDSCGVVRNAQWQAGRDEETGALIWAYFSLSEDAGIEAMVGPGCNAVDAAERAYLPQEREMKAECTFVRFAAPSEPPFPPVTQGRPDAPTTGVQE